MSSFRLLASLPLAILVSASGSASAWTPVAGGSPTWPGPAPYSLHAAGSEDLGGFAGTEPVVRRGMDDWTRLSCSGLTTEYRGRSETGPFQGAPAVIGWIESGWPESPSAIGVTAPSWNGARQIVDAQMALNGVNYAWSNDSGAGSTVNAYSILLHEGGHYFGLGHSESAGATMFYAYRGGILSISADDEAGICTLYPGGDGGPADCTTTGCPEGQACQDGSCVRVAGDGAQCAGCRSDADCAHRCVGYPDGNGYCAARCTSDSDCGTDRCEQIEGVRLCVRRDRAGNADCRIPPTTTPDRDPDPDPDPEPTGSCTTYSDCPSGAPCVDRRCVPVPQGTVGQVCSGSADCTTGLCAVDPVTERSFCTLLCDDMDPCPVGFECVQASGGSRACQPVEAGTDGSSAETRTLRGKVTCAAQPGVQGAGSPWAWSLVLVLGLLGWRRR